MLVVLLLGILFLREPRLERSEEFFLRWLLKNSDLHGPPAPLTVVEIGHDPLLGQEAAAANSEMSAVLPLEYALFLQSVLPFQPTVVAFENILKWRETEKGNEQVLIDLAMRVPLLDVRFFATAVLIQRETGGNLAETLSNLADVLRKRAQMKLKIRAMSSESKASAYIVGSLPFVVFTLVFLMNPSYMGKFFVDERLIIAGIGGIIWMSIGGFIMAKMVNFEI